MSKEKVYVVPNLPTPNQPVEFGEKICTGCNMCVEVRQTDVYVPDPEKGKPPIILYPDECWYYGCCVATCPLWEKGAVRLKHPVIQKLRWKHKETGEHFRIGMPTPPPPNLRPPVGGWHAKA